MRAWLSLLAGLLCVPGMALAQPHTTITGPGVVYDYPDPNPPNPPNSWYGVFTATSTDPFCPIGSRASGGHPVGGLSVWRKDVSVMPPVFTQITIPEDSVATFFTITDSFDPTRGEPYKREWSPTNFPLAQFIPDAPLVPAWRVGDVGHFHVSKSNSPGAHTESPLCFNIDRSVTCDCQAGDPSCPNLTTAPPPVACNVAP